MILRLILKHFSCCSSFPPWGCSPLVVASVVPLWRSSSFAIAGFFTKVVLFPWLCSVGLLSVGVGGLLGGSLGAFLVYFAISSSISAIALWARFLRHVQRRARRLLAHHRRGRDAVARHHAVPEEVTPAPLQGVN